VEVAPNARPPVCRIMDFGRFKYEQRKRQKKQHQIQTKIIKLRPKTDPHDLETKLRHARRFLEAGDRVRFVVRMRGRERAVTERWVSQLNDLTSKLEDVGILTGRPLLEGGGVTCTVEPKKRPVAAGEPGARPSDDDDDLPPLDDFDGDDEDDDDDDFDDDDEDDDDGEEGAPPAPPTA
jgi:translation initiation factor IF-3